MQDGKIFNCNTSGGVAYLRLSERRHIHDRRLGLNTATYALDSGYSASTVSLGYSNDGFFYAAVRVGGGHAKVWKLDDTLTLDTFWDTTDTTGTHLDLLTSGRNFQVYNGVLVFNQGSGGTQNIAASTLRAACSLMSA
jgi:hypothetical protein